MFTDNHLPDPGDMPGLVSMWWGCVVVAKARSACRSTGKPHADRCAHACTCADLHASAHAHVYGHFYTHAHLHARTNNGAVAHLHTISNTATYTN